MIGGIKSQFWLPFCAAATLFMGGCSKREILVEAPFKDGNFIKYENSIAPGGSFTVVASFSSRGENFEVRYDYSGPGIVVSTEPMTIPVSRLGRMPGGDYIEVALPNNVPLWLPVSAMREGDVVKKEFRLGKQMRWQDWSVRVLHITLPVGAIDCYYEQELGYLVGCSGGTVGISWNTRLIETNIQGLAPKSGS